MSRPLTVLTIASEVAPYSKTGGLADVVAALPRALARLGHEVTVVTPRYRGIDVSGASVMALTVRQGAEPVEVAVHESGVESSGAAARRSSRSGPLRLAFVDVPALFDREGMYGVDGSDYADNPRRFAVLARAALEYASRRGTPVDVLHAHDWQAGLAPVLLPTEYRVSPALAATASVTTVHNLAYQGVCHAGWLAALGLPATLFSIDALEFWGQVSFLKGSVLFSDAVTTVSPRYAREVLSKEHGCGFEGILGARGDAFTGILNGIDEGEWDPRADPHLPAPIVAPDFAGKRECKRTLLARFGLPTDSRALARPLVGTIARLVEQKGHGLIAALADRLPRLDAAFVAMGEGEARFEQVWRELARAHPDRFAIHLGYDEPRAHLIQGGADMFLLPSRFEPCGLGQMYAQRYGTVPVVHAVGGLADSVEPFDQERGTGTGFTFTPHTPEALFVALSQAVGVFADPVAWRALQARGAVRDFSWERSAAQYVEVYRRAIDRRQPRPGRSRA
jgi:starch synthase